MTYQQALDYLYSRLPMFTRDGHSAFKKDLTNTLCLCRESGDPQQAFKSIHIAGTNGKGSSSHMLAAILQTAGYKTGLYTSPHLLDFRERIRVNGQPVPEDWVANFTTRHQSVIETIQPSFFEVTVAMAFRYFADEQVDIAVIETGLGGRLDSTNVITPVVSLITNIGFDHMYLLGNTLPEIAAEKAGIIKPGIPVIIGEKHPATAPVFVQTASERGSLIRFAQDEWQVSVKQKGADYQLLSARSLPSGRTTDYQLDLTGSYQRKNVGGVLSTTALLANTGFAIDSRHVAAGLAQVQHLTGLMGRWQTVGTMPLTICDTGHNEDGWREILNNIRETPYRQLRMVLGVMRDKDLGNMLPLLPAAAHYYFCAPDMPRALPATDLTAAAAKLPLTGNAYPSVAQAVLAARREAAPDDLVFIGGSTFVVAEALTLLRPAS